MSQNWNASILCIGQRVIIFHNSDRLSKLHDSEKFVTKRSQIKQNIHS